MANRVGVESLFFLLGIGKIEHIKKHVYIAEIGGKPDEKCD